MDKVVSRMDKFLDELALEEPKLSTAKELIANIKRVLSLKDKAIADLKLRLLKPKEDEI